MKTSVLFILLALTGCSDAPIDPGTNDDAEPQADAEVDSSAPDSEAIDGGVGANDAAKEAAPDTGTPGMLDVSVVSHIVEPEGYGHDDMGRSYTDKNYWEFCMPGAATVALYYFKPKNVTAWPAGDFLEPSHAPSTIPSGGTYWKSSDSVNGYTADGRAYLMYLAMKVKPSTWTVPGIASFASYPSPGANLHDVRDALNWEASGHASNWSTFFYEIRSTSGLTLATLRSDVKKTIDGGHAIVATTDTGYLPNWGRSLSHAITIVGYDDTKNTFMYTDTCGVHCNGSSKAKNGGVWTISQSTMLTAITSDGVGYVK